MNALLIEPTDLLFFRDAIPMSAGQGSGAGCRLPFPTTLHEAFRSTLLSMNEETRREKLVEGRPRQAVRWGNWHSSGHDGKTYIASKAFRSLRTIGPLPWHKDQGLLLTVPLDVAQEKEGKLARLKLWRDPSVPLRQNAQKPSDYQPLYLPVADTSPDKNGVVSGWWTSEQMTDYLVAVVQRSKDGFAPIPTKDLWSTEHRVGVRIDPFSFAAEHGNLFSGSYLRMDQFTRFIAWTEMGDPAMARSSESDHRKREGVQLSQLDWLVLGGEFRLARLWRRQSNGEIIPDPIAGLKLPPQTRREGPCLLKWVLVTPAVFSGGSLPGWCWNGHDGRPPGLVRLHASQRKKEHAALPGKAQLISWCLGKARTVSGFDVVDNRSKPTLLAVPAGSVYYFLCENPLVANALAHKLHWQPRSDFYGEKGCGYGLVSFDVPMHPLSPDVRAMAQELFNS